jgi:glutamine amidotransferase
MCRLFGFKGKEPTKLSFFLVDAPNSLAKQSIMDSRNISNSQGWGVGFYQNRKAFIQKRASSAYFDFNFKFLTDFVETDTMIAHIRDATVGDISDHNAHPFIYGNWIMAHNGTVEGFQLLRSQILKAIGTDFAFEIMGSTDSECVFYLFLSKLNKKVPDIHAENIDVIEVRNALIETIQLLNTLGANIDVENSHKLNVLITNGKMMIASRFGNSLFYTTKNKAIHNDVNLHKSDNEASLKIRFSSCYDNLCKLENESVIVASEELNIDEQWGEVPEQCVITIDNNLDISFASV